MNERQQPPRRSHFRHFRHFETIATRWMDNDVHGHVNKVVHCSLFDTAVNRCLMEAGAPDIHAGAVIGLVVQTHRDCFESIASAQAAAVGQFVHVHVDRSSRRPVALPDALPAALSPLQNKLE